MLGDIEREYCKRCDGGTNQEVIGYSHRFERDPYMEESSQHIIHEMLRCRGCDTVIMREHREIEREDIPPSVIYYADGTSSEIYFKRLANELNRRNKPAWLGKELPLLVQSLVNEIYSALDNGLFRLTAMGIRSMLENVMKERVGDRPFKVLVDEFQKAGYLSTRQALSLDAIIEAGHATIHRGWEPTREDIDTLLDITESLIETVYLHEDRARELDKRVPRREKPDQSSGKKTPDV
jgi:hypothetical protein